MADVLCPWMPYSLSWAGDPLWIINPNSNDLFTLNNGQMSKLGTKAIPEIGMSVFHLIVCIWISRKLHKAALKKSGLILLASIKKSRIRIKHFKKELEAQWFKIKHSLLMSCICLTLSFINCENQWMKKMSPRCLIVTSPRWLFPCLSVIRVGTMNKPNFVVSLVNTRSFFIVTWWFSLLTQ